MRIAVPFAIVIILFAGLLQGAPHADAAATHSVSGKLVSDTGEPIADATVSGWSSSAEGEYSSDKVQTAADGTFKLALGAGKGGIDAWYEEWRGSAHLDVAIEGDVGGLVLTIQTPPPKTALVEGIVVDASGNPLEGATVTLQQGCCYAMPMEEKPVATTVPVEGTPPPSDEPVADASGSSGGGSAGTASSTMIAPSRPIYYDGDYQTATTGADGKFAFKSYPGLRQVTAWAKGYAQSQVNVEAKDGETTSATLTLEKVPNADAVLKGRVIDAHTGLPIANAQVSLSNIEWGRYDYRQTGADGGFEFTTLPGWTQLSVYYYGYDDVVYAEGVSSDAMIKRPDGVPGKQYYQYVASFRLTSGTSDHDVKLEPKPDPTVVLIGYVVDPEAKKGVPNAQVNVWNQDTGDWGSATTDATGSYKILVRPGHYTMNAWAENHLNGALIFDIVQGEATKRVDIETPAGTQKYAPCDDCGPYPMPLAARSYSAPGVATPESAYASDSDAKAGSGATMGAPSDGASSTVLAGGESAPTGDSTRAAAYSGTGGGLPEYDPSAAPDDGIGGATTPDKNAVPGIGLAVGLVLVGAIAVALRRRA